MRAEIPARYYDDPDEANKALKWSEEIIQLARKKIEAA
jgi:hypothetical protein